MYRQYCACLLQAMQAAIPTQCLRRDGSLPLADDAGAGDAGAGGGDKRQGQEANTATPNESSKPAKNQSSNLNGGAPGAKAEQDTAREEAAADADSRASVAGSEQHQSHSGTQPLMQTTATVHEAPLCVARGDAGADPSVTVERPHTKSLRHMHSAAGALQSFCAFSFSFVQPCSLSFMSYTFMFISAG